jgi:hypothetical protein
MGGFGHSIPVVTVDRTPSSASKRGLWSRLFDRPVILLDSIHSQIHEISNSRLRKSTFRDFRRFLNSQIKTPWAATRVIYDYLFDLDHTIAIRGEQANGTDAIRYTIDVVFSDCAGAATVSAEVAWHWMNRYLETQANHLNDTILSRFGLLADFSTRPDRLADTECSLYLPTREYGYAAFRPTTECSDVQSEEDAEYESSLFSLNGSWYELLDPDELKHELCWLESKGATLLNNGRCHCQLCMPDFDAIEFLAGSRL